MLQHHVRFFMSRCAGETWNAYQQRLLERRELRNIPKEITNRPLSDGIGYFYPDGTLYGYVSFRK